MYASLSTTCQSTWRKEVFLHLASIFATRFKGSQTIDDIKIAIILGHIALNLASQEGDSQGAECRMSLAQDYNSKYDQTKDLIDLDIVNWHRERSLEFISSTHPSYLRLLENLGQGWRCRFHTTENLSDLDRAIQFQERLFNSVPEGSMEQAQVLLLADEYIDRYRVTGSLPSLEQADRYFTLATDLNPGDPIVSRIFNEDGDIEKLIKSCQKALAHTEQEDGAKALLVEILGKAYGFTFSFSNSLPDIEQSIRFVEQAVLLTSKDPVKHFLQLKRLGSLFRIKYEKTLSLEDLEASRHHRENALSLGIADKEERKELSWLIGDDLIKKYMDTGSFGNLQLAIQKLQDVINEPSLPSNPGITSKVLSSPAQGYQLQHERTRDKSDLDMVIQHYRAALDLIPLEDQSRSGFLLDLARGYEYRYDQTGALSSLDYSIQLGLEAMHLHPKGDADRTFTLDFVSGSYATRHLRTNESDDLEKATRYAEESLSLTSDDSFHYDLRLAPLGSQYLDLYETTDSMDHWESAMQHLQKALDLTPLDSPNRIPRLSSLGFAYGRRFVMSEDVADFNNAVEALQAALHLMPTGHKNRLNLFISLYQWYISKHEIIGSIEGVDGAIDLYEKTLRQPLDDFAYSVRKRINIGSAYFRRYLTTNERTDLDSAISHLQTRLTDNIIPAEDRVGVGKMLVLIYADLDDWMSAYETARKAISLVPLLTHAMLENRDKQHFLTSAANLASDAAATAAMMGEDAYKAIELLELGRGVITGALNQRRLDVSELEDAYPTWAQEFKSLRDELYDQTKKDPDQRYEIGLKLEESIKEIRKLEGFHRFLMPHSEAEMKSAAKDGLIVIINVSTYRCDAFIIDQTNMQTLDLPGLKYTDIGDRTWELESPGRELLEWLWDTIAVQVLGRLGLLAKPSGDDNLPRIRWILTGPLSKFPIHAAGYHNVQDLTRTVMDRAISSFSPSVSMLIHSQQSQNETENHEGKSGKAVLIGMNELRHAPIEIHHVECICTSMNLDIAKPLSRRKEVLSALDDCTIFHFAGHGHVNKLDPLKSRLVLSGKDDLTLSDLLESNLSGHSPFLAYLSACGTGQITRDELVDEGLHLISAYQVVGFQNVIGTLWRVDDRICVDVATETYKWMDRYGMSSKSVCEGLNRAVRSLRDEWIAINDGADDEGVRKDRVITTSKQTRHFAADNASADPRDIELWKTDSPLLWVPFVHFGA